MSSPFLNYKMMSAVDPGEFRSKVPFPWINVESFLTAEGFKTLLHDYPHIDLFEQHRGIKRRFGQKPHDRYYLAYGESIHHPLGYGGPGVAHREDLSPSWRDFIDELETGPYGNFVEKLLRCVKVKPRYDWHIGRSGSEVSPHMDADAKVATHLFFFNTSEDWDAGWGGETLILDGKTPDAMNPRFNDFARRTPIKVLNNHSLLFQNTDNAWHGVEALRCPAGAMRRLFNVVFERVGAEHQSMIYRAGMVGVEHNVMQVDTM